VALFGVRERHSSLHPPVLPSQPHCAGRGLPWKKRFLVVTAPCAVQFPYVRVRGARRACYALSGDGASGAGVARCGGQRRGTKVRTGR
jgi:hypothetical protein